MKVRNIRQVISTLLTTALLFSLMSMSAFAADTTVDLGRVKIFSHFSLQALA